MLNFITVNKLIERRLNAMADNFTAQLSDSSYSEMSFEERFGLMVDSEWPRSRNNKTQTTHN